MTKASDTKGRSGSRAPASGRRRPSADETRAREAVLRTARAMSASGLSPGRSGNVSCRFGDGMLITPTALAYDVMRVDDIAFVASDGTVPAHSRTPSSEWQFHLSAYAARPDRNALVHTHAENATALASAHLAIPAFHYMVALAGGSDIPCVPYATFGSDALARHVAEGLKARDACLLANHGMIAIATTLDGALELAHEVECLAALYIKVRMLGREHLLADAEMIDMVEKFKGYGRAAVAAGHKKNFSDK